MANEREGWFLKLEAAKTIIGIIAVLVGGYWTYLKFIRTEAPLFEISSRVDWAITEPVDREGSCMQSFNIHFVNTGKSVFIVKKVLTRGWKFYFQRDKAEPAKLLDLDKIETTGQIVLQKEFPDPSMEDTSRWYPLLGKYRPGEEYSHEFLLLLKRDDRAWIFLKTEIFFEGETKPKVAGIWRPICEMQPTGTGQPAGVVGVGS